MFFTLRKIEDSCGGRDPRQNEVRFQVLPLAAWSVKEYCSKINKEIDK